MSTPPHPGFTEPQKPPNTQLAELTPPVLKMDQLSSHKAPFLSLGVSVKTDSPGLSSGYSSSPQGHRCHRLWVCALSAKNTPEQREKAVT